MSDENTYKGSCFCGAVEISVTGNPVLQGYCHCGSCRHWGATPISTFILFSPKGFKITKGEDSIITYNKTDKSYRKSCKICGGHLFTDYKALELIDVYADVIKDFPFEPAMHVNYGEAVISVKDGLPKYKDVPRGSGELMPE